MPKGRLSCVKPRVEVQANSRLHVQTIGETRIRGRQLQTRRLRIWTKDPRCAHCHRLTVYPHGFELDHRIPLHLGGQDTDENSQVLCVRADGDGCHARKSALEVSSL